MSYPVVDHRDPTTPQPEWCAVCGERRGGGEVTRISGTLTDLDGQPVCRNTRACRLAHRASNTWHVRFKTGRKPTTIGSGKSPVYEPGASDWLENIDPQEPWPP